MSNLSDFTVRELCEMGVLDASLIEDEFRNLAEIEGISQATRDILILQHIQDQVAMYSDNLELES